LQFGGFYPENGSNNFFLRLDKIGSEYFFQSEIGICGRFEKPVMSKENTYQEILKKYAPQREYLVSAFQDIQEKEGYLSEESVAETANYFGISKADAYSVVSFYAQFKFKRSGKHIIRVCKGTACHVRGSGTVLAALEERLGIKEGETTPDGLISLERVACLGACALAPAMVVDEKVHARVTLAQLDKILKELK